MCVEIMKLAGQDICVRDEVKLVSPKSLLHLDIIVAQSIFASYLVALWKMIYSLIFIEAFVKITFTRTRRPEQVPLM